MITKELDSINMQLADCECAEYHMPSSLPVICEEGPRGNILKKYLLYQQRKLVKVSYFVFFSMKLMWIADAQRLMVRISSDTISQNKTLMCIHVMSSFWSQ